jgi:hypothetical protein
MTTHCRWMRLVLAHAIVALGSPLLGVLLFFLLSFTPQDSFHFGGLLALSFGVFFTYLLFGVLTVLAVLVASPLLLVISRIRNAVLAFCAAGLAGGLFGWVFCTLFVAPGEGGTYGLVAKVAGALTGIAAATVLELGWRTRWHAKPPPETHEPQVGHMGPKPAK